MYTIIALIIGICVSGLIGAAVFSIYETRDRNLKVSIKRGCSPVVTFTVGNTTLNFILDTGSNASCIDREALSLIRPYADYTLLKDEVASIGIEGASTLCKQCRLYFSYGKRKFSEVFVIKDLANLLQLPADKYNKQIHGLLGTDFLQRYRYVIDFERLLVYS